MLFLLYGEENYSVYTYISSLDLPYKPASSVPPPSRSSPVLSELRVLHSRFLLVVYFTYGSVYGVNPHLPFLWLSQLTMFFVYVIMRRTLIHLYYQRFYLLLESWQVLYRWWECGSVCHLHFLISLPWVGEKHYLVLSREMDS